MNVIENNQSPQNTPVDPEIKAEESQESAKEAQEQFVPQAGSDQPPKTHQPDPKADRDRKITRYGRYIRKIIIWIILAQGIISILSSMGFIFIELPKLETLLQQGIITQEAVNTFSSDAILKAISGSFNMLFAFLLSKRKNKAVKATDITIDVLLVLANVWITNFLNEQQTGKLIGDFLFSLLSRF